MTFKFCRVCFEKGDDLYDLGDGNNSYGHKLANCVPEIDINIVINPAICKSCVSMLEVAYALRQKCIENEKKFHSNFSPKRDSKNDTVAIIDTSRSEMQLKSKKNHLLDATIHKLQKKQSEVKNLFFRGSHANLHNNKTTVNPKVSSTINNANKNSDEVSVTVIELDKNSDEDLVKEVNEMCADLKEFDDKLTMLNKSNSIEQLFSDDDDNQDFELNLDLENLLDADDSTTRKTVKKISSVNGKISCTICKELHDEANIQSHMKIHDTRSTYDCECCGETFSDTCELETHNLTHLENLCDVCGKVFNSKSDLAKHQQSHVSICCGEKFVTGSLLQLHMYQKHGMSCGICKKSFGSFNAIFFHLLDHMGKSNLHCQQCNKTFDDKTEKLNHQCDSSLTKDTTSSAKIVNSKYKYKCKQCLTGFYMKKTFFKHIRSCNIRGHSCNCDLCGDLFVSKIELKKHLLSKHSSVNKEDALIKCEFCKNKFNASSDHKCGTVQAQETTCQLCSSEFNNYVSLTRHIQENHCTKIPMVSLTDYRKDLDVQPNSWQEQEVSDPVRLHCHACGEIYMNQQLYLKHMRMFHSFCIQCRITFNDTKSIITHVYQHYANDQSTENDKNQEKAEVDLSVTSVKAYCEACEREFPNESLYEAHKGQCNEEWDNQCYICKKRFRSTQELYDHITTHLTKLFTCPTCFIIFNTELDLQKHIGTHNRCEICDKTFTLKVNLIRHMTYIHSTAFLHKRKRKMQKVKRIKKHKVDYICRAKCKFCSKLYQSVGFLRRHIREFHGQCTIESHENFESDEDMIAQNSTENLIRCYICQEQFDSEYNLRQHVSVHI